MTENEHAVNYSLGVKPTEASTVPIAGQPKSEEKPEEKGIPVWVKGVGALVTIFATLAGIVFGVQQIIQSNRNFQAQLAKDEREGQEHRQETDHKFAKEMQEMRDQADKDRLTLSTQNAAREAELARAEADKRQAESKIAEDSRLQAVAETQKAQAELEKADRQIKHDEDLQEKTAETDRRKQEADQFKQLQTSIVKLRLTPSDTADFSTLGTITEALGVEGILKHAAADAIDSRLELFPSRGEIEFIFSALPDAGYSDALDIAVRANRRAWKVLGSAIDADFHTEIAQLLVKENATGRHWSNQTDIALVLVHSKLNALLGGKHTEIIDREFNSELHSASGKPDTGEQALPGVPSLDSVVGVLLASRQTIERLVPMAHEDDAIDLDDCFPPNFAPEKPTRSSRIFLRRSYIVGADFRTLADPSTRHQKLFMQRGEGAEFLAHSAGTDPSVLLSGYLNIPPQFEVVVER